MEIPVSLISGVRGSSNDDPADTRPDWYEQDSYEQWCIHAMGWQAGPAFAIASLDSVEAGAAVTVGTWCCEI